MTNFRPNRRRAAVLISGSGTNLQSFIDKIQTGDLALDLCVVLSNNSGAAGLSRANNAQIPTVCISHNNYPDRQSFDAALVEALDPYLPDFIILAGFMRVLTPIFIAKFEGRILNIHPSLLPDYPGLNTHQRAIDAGEKWAGSTVHFATEELDAGPMIIQGRVPIKREDTAEQLAARVLKIEHQIYPEALSLLSMERLKYEGGAAYLDGKLLLKPIQYS
ncbi:MAG: phosphoribosylglycinamide formyltransferase [Woeseia sp.]|nr:phosphoribosylglycinamide formyltransferase [Woeseia sp.]|tara:strand:+ start:101 stop:757 length:657 start_codon:yes stop_codon:yes gene_type:complete